MNEQWIHEMRQKMAAYRRSAPELSWDEIDRAVAASKAHKARLLWLRRMAAAAVVLLIAGVGYWRFMRDDAESARPTTASVSSQPQDGNHGDQSRNLASSQHHALGSAASHSKEPVSVVIAKAAQKPNTTSTSVPESEAAATIPPVDTVNTTPPDENEPPHTDRKESAKPTDRTSPVIYPSDLHQRSRLDNRLTAKVYLSSTMAGRQTEYFNIGMHAESSKGGSGSYLWPPMDKQPIDQLVHHRQPVRFGLSLRYRLDDRWSVESGLSYTRLSSDITTIVEDKATVTEQRLNYIGLPLNISYDLWKNRRFGLYVSAGGMIEKSLDTSPWQFSLNGAAGAEYKLTDFFSLYAEPGLGYYFKDGSSIPTIYQDHPLNFNLSFGLRFNLK